jgi:hypothetical protein
MPQAAAALSPAPPATTTRPDGAQRAGGRAALDKAGHLVAAHVARVEQPPGPVARADIEP